jgi:hypothetical protein
MNLGKIECKILFLLRSFDVHLTSFQYVILSQVLIFFAMIEIMLSEAIQQVELWAYLLLEKILFLWNIRECSINS